jgi:hypothetical protein
MLENCQVVLSNSYWDEIGVDTHHQAFLHNYFHKLLLWLCWTGWSLCQRKFQSRNQSAKSVLSGAKPLSFAIPSSKRGALFSRRGNHLSAAAKIEFASQFPCAGVRRTGAAACLRPWPKQPRARRRFVRTRSGSIGTKNSKKRAVAVASIHSSADPWMNRDAGAAARRPQSIGWQARAAPRDPGSAAPRARRLRPQVRPPLPTWTRTGRSCRWVWFYFYLSRADKTCSPPRPETGSASTDIYILAFFVSSSPSLCKLLRS